MTFKINKCYKLIGKCHILQCKIQNPYIKKGFCHWMYDLGYKVWPQTYISMNRKCVNPNEVIRAAHLDTRDFNLQTSNGI